MRYHRMGRIASVVLSAALLSWSCADGTVASDADTGNGGSTDTGSVSSDDPSFDTSDTGDDQTGETGNSGERTLKSVEIRPSSVTLTSKNGSKPTETFDVYATYTNGDEGLYTGEAEFVLEDRTVGEITPREGVFTASGTAGGTTKVEAKLPDDPQFSPITASVRVKVERVVEAGSLPNDVENKFGNAMTDPNAAPNVVYPLNGAVMPQSVFPADVQWTEGSKGDLFKVRLAKENAKVTAYLKHTGSDFGKHWRVDDKSWGLLTRTDPKQSTEIQVFRYVKSSGNVFKDASGPAIKFAEASLRGSIYYWNVGAGRIKRIDGGSGNAVSFMPNPPDSIDGENCVGCHAVSNDGQYMVGRLGGGNDIGAVFDLTKDLTQDPVPTEFPLADDGPKWWYATWKPDDSRLMVSRGPEDDTELALMDPFAGTFMTPQSGALPGSGATQPAWAPDDSLVAYVSGADNWGGRLGEGDISAIPVNGTDSFGSPRVLREASNIPNAHPGGDTLAYPTWSPDSEWIAFAHGTGGRAETDKSALYMMRRDGSDVVRLDNANGGPMTEDTFKPNFAPFETKEHYWLSFLSRRPYGNSKVGNRGSSEIRQVWISAIDKDAPAGSDPSSTAYWLPGQDVTTRNISAFWAPQACREDGESCTVDSVCCGGECAENSDGEFVCSPPPPEECRERGETCSSDSDCCGTRTCVSNVCIQSGG